jgi:hypothetical protein
MQMESLRQVLVCLFGVLLIAGHVNGAHACFLTGPERFNVLQGAEIVVRGALLSEPILNRVKYQPPYYDARMKVLEVLTGDVDVSGRSLDLVFYKSTNRRTRGLNTGAEIFVGLKRALVKGKTGEQLVSVSRGCDTMGVVLVTPKNALAVKKGIKGEHFPK